MEGSKTVLLVGTLDTKGAEYAYLRDRLRSHGVDTILADAGVNEPVGAEPDLHVASETGADPRALAEAGDRGAAVTAMADAAEALARRLYAEGKTAACSEPAARATPRSPRGRCRRCRSARRS